MANKKTYWKGKGQVLIDGKKYRTGQAIPATKVDKKRLDAWKEDGLVGTADFDTEDASLSKTALEVAKTQLDSVSNELVKANKRIKELEKDSGPVPANVKELEASLKVSQARVEELETERGVSLDKVEELEAKVKQLTADLDTATKPGAK